jgi:hypothetical protein
MATVTAVLSRFTFRADENQSWFASSAVLFKVMGDFLLHEFGDTCLQDMPLRRPESGVPAIAGGGLLNNGEKQR